MIARWLASASVGMAAILENRVRSTLSGLGVVLGVAGLTAILALTDGMAETVRAATDAFVGEVTIQPRGFEVVDGVSVRSDRVMRLGLADLDALREQVGDRASLALRVRVGERVSLDGNGNAVAALVAWVTPEYPAVRAGRLVAGRALSDEDVALGARVAVVPSGFRPGEPSELLERTISFRDEAFRIVGVWEVDDGAREPAEILLPFHSGLEGALPDPAPFVVLRVGHRDDVMAVSGDVRRWITSHFWPGAANVVHFGDAEILNILDRIRWIRWVGGAVVGVSILVGMIGVMNAMLSSVLERVREIGIRKAAGARSRDILAQFLIESVAVSGFGAVLGLILGAAVAATVAWGIRQGTGEAFRATLSLSSLTLIFILTVAVGVISGIYPARRAAALSPVDAMRHE